MPLTNHQVQRAVGALVGSAVGDALGAPFEFQPPGRYSARFPEPVRGGTGEMVGNRLWAPGEFTDDTQMALALAQSLLANRGFDPTDLYERWVRWSVDSRDVGILTSHALGHGDHVGAAAHAHGATGGRSASNGAVMRNTPVALWTLGDPPAATAELARAQAALTHYDPDCGTAAALHATMLRAGILGQNMFAALDAAVAEIADDDVRARWAELLGPSWTPADAVHPNGTVWTCTAQAVWAVRHHRSFEEAVVAAVDLGDDADTVACVAGSLAGARWGIQQIPSRWTTYVHGELETPTGTTRYDNAGLHRLAVELLGRTPRSITPAEPEPGGPARVHDELPVHAAEWKGAASVPTHWAVVSACRPDGDFVDHPVRREVYLEDQYHDGANHDPLAALLDAVDSVDAFLEEDPSRPVVVHCHGGRSRTALILKAWAMRRFGWSEAEAHDWLVAAWPRAHRDNPVFLEILTRDWPPA